MNYHVKIIQSGRTGWINYVEDGKLLPFGWDFSALGIEIYVPSSEEWNEYCDKHKADWAKDRRTEILERLAQEVCRQKAKKAKASINDNWINIEL
jgi:hypothetical protein